ncbi:MAG: response regulator, partial [Intestinibacillus sp.]
MYKILIVDDEESIRTGLLVGVDWEALNCEVVDSVSDGVQALESIRRTVPDIVLSDISMQRMSGLELCAVISEEYPQIKCILLTGFYDFDNACQAIRYGVIELLLKPTSSAKISAAVKRAIGKIKENNIADILCSEIQHQAIANLALKQSMLLQNIFSGVDYGQELIHLLEEANINLTRYFVITIFVDCLAREEDAPGFYTQTEKIVSKYIASALRPLQYYIAYRSDQFIRVVIDADAQLKNARFDLHNRCRELSSMIDTLTDFYITVGISNPHDQAQELAAAALEADNASRFPVYTAEDPVIDYAALPIISDEVMGKIRTLMDSLTDAIRRLDLSASDTLLLSLKEYCVSRKIPYLENYNICLYLLNVCFQQFLSYDIPGFSLNEQYSFSQKLSGCKTIDSLYTLLQSTIHLISSTVCNKQKPTDLVGRIVRYIHSNYASALSLEDIADVFSLSAGYLGRLFKSRMNVNLSTYIQQV